MLHEARRQPTSVVRENVSLTVLLAEDHLEFRELVARALEADHAIVDCVEDGSAAINKLIQQRFRPDVVVTDVRMPNKTGIDILRALRAANLTIPVILLTGFGQAIDRSAIEGLGGFIILEKPFDFDDLRTALRNLAIIKRLNVRPIEHEQS